MRILLDGHFRDNGNAHASAHHAQDAAELATLENDLRMEARAVAGGDRGVPETVAVAQQEKWLFAKIAQGQRAAPGEGVFLRNGGEEALRKQRDRVELVTPNRQREYGHVDGAGAQSIEQDRRNFFDDRQARLGKLARERSQPHREKVGRDRRDHADRKCSRDGILALDDVALRGFQFAQDRTRARKECFANLGEADRSAQSVEESRAEFVFELKDLLGKRRLRDVRMFRGAAE